MIDHTPLTSSNLKSCGYDPVSRTLEVAFHNGTTYRYKDVDPSHHEGLKSADSAGNYFHAKIKGKHAWERA